MQTQLKARIAIQTLSNLRQAGILRDCELSEYANTLDNMDDRQLLATLVESHELLDNAPAPIMYYPIAPICQN